MTLAALAALLREEGGLIGAAVAEPTDARALGDGLPEPYALLLDAIHEGYLLHYGQARVVQAGDPDLALLAGDRLYALGLSKLAELGDLAAVRLLADAISECARLHAEGRAADAPGVWRATAAALAG